MIAVCIAVVGMLALSLLNTRRCQQMESGWAKERQLLLERIQHPERVSVAEPGPVLEPLDTDGEAMALVGTIDYGDEP